MATSTGFEPCSSAGSTNTTSTVMLTREAGQRAEAAPATEGEHGDHEQHDQHPHRGGAFVVGEVVDRGAVGQRRRGQHQHVADFGHLQPAAGDRLLQQRLLTGVGPVRSSMTGVRHSTRSSTAVPAHGPTDVDTTWPSTVGSDR